MSQTTSTTVGPLTVVLVHGAFADASSWTGVIERLMTQAHQQARSVLTEHRDALDRLAQALLQEEVLEREQVLAILNGGQNTRGGAGS